MLFRIDYYNEGNYLHFTDVDCVNYDEAEIEALEELVTISENGCEENIPLENLSYRISFNDDFDEEETDDFLEEDGIADEMYEAMNYDYYEQ